MSKSTAPASRLAMLTDVEYCNRDSDKVTLVRRHDENNATVYNVDTKAMSAAVTHFDLAYAECKHERGISIDKDTKAVSLNFAGERKTVTRVACQGVGLVNVIMKIDACNCKYEAKVDDKIFYAVKDEVANEFKFYLTSEDDPEAMTFRPNEPVDFSSIIPGYIITDAQLKDNDLVTTLIKVQKPVADLKYCQPGVSLGLHESTLTLVTVDPSGFILVTDLHKTNFLDDIVEDGISLTFADSSYVGTVYGVQVALSRGNCDKVDLSAAFAFAKELTGNKCHFPTLSQLSFVGGFKVRHGSNPEVVFKVKGNDLSIGDLHVTAGSLKDGKCPKVDTFCSDDAVFTKSSGELVIESADGFVSLPVVSQMLHITPWVVEVVAGDSKYRLDGKRDCPSLSYPTTFNPIANVFFCQGPCKTQIRFINATHADIRGKLELIALDISGNVKVAETVFEMTDRRPTGWKEGFCECGEYCGFAATAGVVFDAAKGSYSIYDNPSGKCPSVKSGIARVVELSRDSCQSLSKKTLLLEVTGPKMNTIHSGMRYSGVVEGSELTLTVKSHSFVLYPKGRKD